MPKAQRSTERTCPDNCRCPNCSTLAAMIMGMDDRQLSAYLSESQARWAEALRGGAPAATAALRAAGAPVRPLPDPLGLGPGYQTCAEPGPARPAMKAARGHAWNPMGLPDEPAKMVRPADLFDLSRLRVAKSARKCPDAWGLGEVYT